MIFPASKRAEQARTKLRNAGELGRGIATYSTPTPERRNKAPEGWAVESQPGGLKTYRALTPYQANENHFSAKEQAAALRFVRDMELAGRIKIVSSRPYDGTPYTGPGSGTYLRSQAQLAAAERVEWILANMAEEWLAFLDVVLMGVQYQCEGKPWSLEELGGKLSVYTGKDQRRACAVGFAKGAFLRLDEAYAGWEIERRRRHRERERRRLEDITVRTNVAPQLEAQRDQNAELLLRIYRRDVLGQRNR
jgi:hypothetical protein